jgi:hypothetical protein
VGVFGTSAGTEPGVDGYLRGQVFNREVPEGIKAYLSIRANKNWAEVGELVEFTIRRRFKKSDRGSKKRPRVVIKVSSNNETLDLIIPAGAKEMLFSRGEYNSYAQAMILGDRNYNLATNNSDSVLYLVPYTVRTYRHTLYVYGDIFRKKWVYESYPWATPSFSADLTTIADPGFGPLAAGVDRTSYYLDWGLYEHFVSRLYTPVYSVVNNSPNSPGLNLSVLNNPANQLHPGLNLSLYGFLTGATSLRGQPCPPYTPPYQAGSFPLLQPNSNTPIYSAGTVATFPAAWTYNYRKRSVVDLDTAYCFDAAEIIDTVITPNPPPVPKFKAEWAEDPDFVL